MRYTHTVEEGAGASKQGMNLHVEETADLLHTLCIFFVYPSIPPIYLSSLSCKAFVPHRAPKLIFLYFVILLFCFFVFCMYVCMYVLYVVKQPQNTNYQALCFTDQGDLNSRFFHLKLPYMYKGMYLYVEYIAYL